MASWVFELRRYIGNRLLMINAAGGWIKNDHGEVLLQKRSQTEEDWGFPGGILELGESYEEAAVREVKEETGLDVEVNSLIGVYSKYLITLENGHRCQTITAMFEMHIVGGQLIVSNSETYGLRFFPPASVPPLYSEQHRDILKDYLNGNVPSCR